MNLRGDPQLARGIVVGEPNGSDLIDVVIPAFDEQQVFDNIVYMPRGTDAPAPGAQCLVAFDDQHAPWVVAWYGAKVSETNDSGSRPDEDSDFDDADDGATDDGERGNVKVVAGDTFVAQTTHPADGNAPSGSGERQLPKKYLMDFLELLAGRLGQTLYTNTFTRHSYLTSSGNPSDHWPGNAADLHTTPGLDSDLGDRIAFHALRLCGLSTDDASALANGSTGYTRYAWKHKGLWYSVQVLWRVDDHHDHVHVGVRRANRGEFPGKY